MKIPLTQAHVASALKDRSVVKTLRDTIVPGFYLRVGPQAASYYLSYKPAGRRPDGRQFPSQDIKIGTTESHSLAEARREAARLKVEVSEGKDPSAIRRADKRAEALRRRRMVTMATAAEAYLESGVKGSKNHVTTESGSLRLAIREMDVADTPPAEVTTADVLRMLELNHGQPRAVHRFGALRRFMDDLVNRDVIDANPCDRVAKRKRPKPPAPRCRVYTAAEVRALLQADGLVPVRRRFLTAAIHLPLRLGELAELRWRDVDPERLRLCLDHKATKNGDPFMMPVPEPVFAQVFDSSGKGAPDSRVFQLAPKGGSFKGRTKFAKQIREASGVGDFNFHDLRRTFTTCLSELGVGNPAVADALLNHRQSETRSGVIASYNHSSLWPQKVEVMKTWAKILEEVGRTGRWPSVGFVPESAGADS